MKYLGLSIGAIFLLIFMASNVYISQRFPSLYFRIVQDRDIESSKEFLQHIKGSPLYKSQYAYFNNLFKNELNEERMFEEQKNYATKEKYRTMLQKNPKSRDALVMLALYELRGGNNEEAARFYSQAKAVDPWLKINSLER